MSSSSQLQPYKVSFGFYIWNVLATLQPSPWPTGPNATRQCPPAFTLPTPVRCGSNRLARCERRTSTLGQSGRQRPPRALRPCEISHPFNLAAAAIRHGAQATLGSRPARAVPVRKTNHLASPQGHWGAKLLSTALRKGLNVGMPSCISAVVSLGGIPSMTPFATSTHSQLL